MEGDGGEEPGAGGVPHMVAALVNLIAVGAIVFGGIVPYVPQYLQIQRLGSVEGFSTHVCLALLLANLLRIMFWVGHWYEMPLLVQSFIMVATQLLLLRLCVRVQREHEVLVGAAHSVTKIRRLRDLDPAHFWRWSYFGDYVLFLAVFSGVGMLLTLALLDMRVYVELLGFLSLLIEAGLGLPQLLRNWRKRSTVGMSVVMVCCWLSGDIFKTVYFILRSAPAQFYICGALQASVDVFILCQVYQYAGGKEAVRVAVPVHYKPLDKR